MDSAAEALLIIVSATLSVFLIVGIIAIIYFIRILKRADRVAESVESAASAVRKGAKAMPVANIFSKFMSNDKEK